MSAEATTAIVLKVVDFSETSCVVTLLTRDFGKISALAKGARRKRSPFEGAIDVLAICRIGFLRKSVDTLDLLTEAKLLRRFRSASEDLSRLYACLYIVELVKTLTDRTDASPELFELVRGTVEAIDTGQPVVEQLLRFELRLLKQIGQQAELFQCVGCGRTVAEAAQMAINVSAGGVICDSCRIGKQGTARIHLETLTTMKALCDENIPLEQLQIAPQSRGEIRGLLDQKMAELLGHRPRMFHYLRYILKN